MSHHHSSREQEPCLEAVEAEGAVFSCAEPEGFDLWSGRLVHDRITARSGGTVAVRPGGVVVKSAHVGRPLRGGGARGEVCGFSPASRRRMNEFLTGVDWSRCDAAFVALTYHEDMPDSWEGWKGHLRAFKERLARKYGACIAGAVWKLEFQRRGAPHFHLVVFFHRLPVVNLGLGYRRNGEAGFWRWAAHAWAGVVGGEATDRAHLRYGVHVEPCEVQEAGGLRRLMRYLSKYLAKEWKHVDKLTGELLPTGRVWGHWWEVPEAGYGVFELSAKGLAVLYRYLRRWGQGSRYLEGLKGHRGCLVLGDGDLFLRMVRSLPDALLSMERDVRRIVGYGGRESWQESRLLGEVV